MNDFAQRLRQARLTSGLTLKAAAERWGIPLRSLIRYEQGGTPTTAARTVLEGHITKQEERDNGKD